MHMFHRIRQSPAFLLSLVLHGVLFSFLFLNMSKSSQPLIVNKGEKIVHATAIESTQVEAIVKQLKDEKIQQQQALIAQQKKIEDQAKAVEAKRIAEQKALEELKQQHELELKKAEQEKIDDAKALGVLKEKQAAEQKKLAALKEEQKVAAEKLKKAKAAEEEAAKLNKQKDDEAKAAKQKQQYEAAAALQKQIATKQAAIAQQRSEAINGVVDQYKGLILEAISKNWLVPPGTDPKLACQLVITLGASGQVMNVQVVKGSGNALLDQSAVAAVYKASPLPMPGDADAAALFKQFSLTLKPEQFVEI